MLTGPAVAQEPQSETDRVPCSSLSDPGLTVASEAEGLELAERCGREVEIEGLRETAARFIAQPSGAIEAEVYAAPQWTVDDSGEWVDIDTTLNVDGDGTVRASAVVGDLSVSPGGHAEPLVRLTSDHADVLEVWWPESLPEPELDGAEAVYPNVFDGVDLVVEAGRDGFSYRLVVHDPTAATNPALTELSVELGGTLVLVQDEETGTVAARDAVSGEDVYVTAGALMWDSSVPEAPVVPQGMTSLLAEPASPQGNGSRGDPADPGRVESMEVALDGNTLTIVPDAAMLADPETVFPVVIDPSFDTPRWTWATVGNGQYADNTWWDDAAFPRSGGLRAGFNGWVAAGQEGYGVWRSFVRFDLRTLWGSNVDAARVELTVHHTGGCGSYPLELWQTRFIAPGAVPTSWNSKLNDWLHGGPLDTRTVPSANSAGGCSESYPNRKVVFNSEDLTHHVTRHVNQPYDSITLGLRASNETSRDHWFRAQVETMKLVVQYQPVMAVPSELTVDNVSCLAPEGARTVGAFPVFAAVAHSTDGLARMTYTIRNAATGATVATHTSSGAVDAGVPYEWTRASALPNGAYEWQVRADTVDAVTARTTTWCSFEVDAAVGTIDILDDETLVCPYDVTGMDPETDLLEAYSENGALLLAEACGFNVEVTSERDFDLRVVADPDGLLTAESAPVPAWAENTEGEWVEIDTGFTTTPDGRIVTEAVVSDLEISQGGTGPLVTATAPEGGSVALTWPQSLPVPVVDGDTATYPDVFDGVDLRVVAGSDGFSYELVVKTPEAAANPALTQISVGISADGLTVTTDAEGGVIAVDGDGEVVFSAPVAFMWDSSTPPDEDPDAMMMALSSTETEEGSGGPEDNEQPVRYAEMPIELDGSTLSITPDQDLLSDPDAEFPIVIDPPFTGKTLHWATVHRQQAGRGWTDDGKWPRSAGMRVGNLQYWPGYPCGDACGLWRSMMRFDIKGLQDKQVVSAKVKMTQTHTSGCGTYDLQLWRVSAFTSGTTWNKTSGEWSTRLETKGVTSSNRTNGCSWTGTRNRGVTFDSTALRNAVNSAANGSAQSISFGLRTQDETLKSHYRTIDPKSVRLEVEYNRPAQTPTGLRTNGKDCHTGTWASAPWTTEVRPTMSGIPRDPDGKPGVKIEVRKKDSSSNFRTWSKSSVTHNQRITWPVPVDKQLPSGEYQWRMASVDNYKQGNTAWSGWCKFKIDTLAPSVPKVELVGPDDPKAGDLVTFRLKSSDKHSGMTAFHWGVNEEAQRDRKSSSGTTTITVTTPGSGDRIWLYVWAEDKAGNTSKPAVVDFRAPRDRLPGQVGAWRLDGDGLDDSGARKHLELGRSSGWTPSGTTTPAGDAMLFNGSDCVSTEDSVVDTDVPYTVTAWVRLDQTGTGVQRMVSQAGEKQSGFVLGYRASSNTWEILTPIEDAADSPSPHPRLNSTVTATVGRWTHVAASVDPGGKELKLWVDGQLQGTRSISHEAWHADGPMHIGCSSATSPRREFNNFRGAIQHVGLWDGLLTTQEIQAAMKGGLKAGVAGSWMLRGNGDDASMHNRGMEAPAHGITWIDDQWGRPDSAANLDGTSCFTSGETIVNRSEESFSVSAWVRPDEINATSEQLVVGEHGGEWYKFKLRMWTDGHWGLSMGTGPTGTGARNATAATPGAIGEWTHLIGVYDIAEGQIRLYVNGELAATQTINFGRWQGSGNISIGCRGTASGAEGGGKFKGAISDVQLWRGAITTAEASRIYGGNKAAEHKASWPLNGRNTTDTIGGHGLTLHGTDRVDYNWGRNRAGQVFTCLEFKGSGWAQTAGPVVRTDESFTIAAWVRLDSKSSTHQTFLSQAGDHRVGFNLNYHAGQDRFQFAMPSADTSGSVTWHSVYSNESPEIHNPARPVTGWYHIAVVVDIPANKMRMYVSGEFVAEANALSGPWNADGPMFLGTHGRKNGDHVQYVHGAVDGVQIWSSTLDPDRIATIARGR
jgi:hypothetical protein